MAKFDYQGAIEILSEVQLEFTGEILEKREYKDT